MRAASCTKIALFGIKRSSIVKSPIQGVPFPQQIEEDLPMPSSVFRSSLAALTITAALMMAPAVASAAKGDCGQPQTDGANPTATDCLYILKTAVGAVTCTPTCVCDVNNSGGVSATDALTCLKKAVGQAVTLDCGAGCGGVTTTTLPPEGCEANVPVGCPAKLNTCTSADFVSQTGSDLDTGWNGLGHNQDLVGGATIAIDIVRRCVDDPNTICKIDADCTTGTCRPFCDCDDPNNSICDVTGPTGQRRCVKDLAVCSTNTDCGAGGRCEHFFGPPLPTSAANTPACITSYFQEDITGTADSETGEGVARTLLRSRVHLGVTNDKPCPACGLASQNPQVGQAYSCSGGPNNGQACTVEAVSPTFGGVSSSCPPDATSNVSGEGLAIRFREVTTGTTTRTAEIPCLFSGGCVDGLGPNNGQCATNADCARCTNDLSTPCSSNADCSGGTCATSPDQPISCGLYCHCGFCNNDPQKPCFNGEDCAPNEICQAGNSTTGQQDQPNACSDLVCGRANAEECCNTQQDGSTVCPEASSTGLSGKCSLKPFLACSTDPQSDLFGACSQQGGGDCVASARPCFGGEISRTGLPSPIGTYCVDDPSKGACTSNADCATGACVADTSEPQTVALFCVPKTTSAAINAAAGIPGPGAITFNSVIFACRCGDGKVGCSEQCDDGNNTNGDGCDQACRTE
jgi:cysteine-rich repeat protein